VAYIGGLRGQKNYGVETFKKDTQVKIDGLREKIKKLKGLSKEQKAKIKDKIYSEIGTLREANKQERLRLQMEFKASSDSLRSTHTTERKRLKTEYDNKYVEELAKIRSDPKFRKKHKK
jgi:hypothetical protein